MPRRQVILMRSIDRAGRDDDGDGLPPLGSADEVLGALARFNTAPDGSAPGRNHAAMNLVATHGPGFVAEMSTADDDVRQVMVSMTDEEFAFPVLARLCREQKWTMLDPDTGQQLRFGA